jgi:pimeloyl-ACP methyl ester carboxylesterase
LVEFQFSQLPRTLTDEFHFNFSSGGLFSYSWRKQIDTVRKMGYRVIAVDLPGFGYSKPNAQKPPTAQEMYGSKALSSMLVTLVAGIQKRSPTTSKFFVVGHDFVRKSDNSSHFSQF